MHASRELLFGWFGCFENSLETTERLLKEGCNIALSPSGIEGKQFSFDSIESDTAFGTASILRKYRVPGFVRLAVKHGAKIVPVLSVNENAVYRARRFLGIGFWPLVWIWGDRVFRPLLTSVDIRYGAPIDCAGTDGDRESLVALADLYYRRLQELSDDNDKVIVTEAYGDEEFIR